MADTAVKGPLAFTAANGTAISTYDADFAQLVGGGGYVGITSNKLTMLFSDNTQDFVFRDGNGTYTADQYAAATIGSTPDAFSIAMLALRCSADTDANRDFYLLRIKDVTTVERWNNGSSTTLGTPSITWAANDVVKFRAVTNGANCDLVVLKNGTVQTTISDTSPLSGGKPGVGLRMSSANFMQWDDLELGNVTAPAPPVITGPSGAAGAGSSSKSVAEGVTAVHTFTADVAVSWSKNGGADEADFTINSSTGALAFAAAPDFEAAGDSDTNNTYVVVVRATATVGGATADQTVTVTVTNLSEPPLAPTIGTAAAGNASASVAFTPPSNTGRPAISGYTATSSPGGLTGTGASSPITVSGLTNGTAYTFTVTATNADGTGPASAASNSVTPSAGGDTTPPTQTGSISIGTVTSSSIQMSWPAGSDNVAVTAYEVSKDGGTNWTSLGNVLTYTFTGLTPSTSYPLRVRAKDAAGNVSTPALAASQSTSAGGGGGGGFVGRAYYETLLRRN